MKKTRIFRSMYFDSVPIESGKETYRFFESVNNGASSIRDLSESDVINFLFTNAEMRNFLIAGFFDNPSNVLSFLETKNPIVDGRDKPGDIDIMLLNPDFPNKILAFECKKVKILSKNDEESHINNINKLQKGIIQANAYLKLRFYCSYLVVILLDDGREMTTPNPMFRYGKSERIEKIYEFANNSKLNTNVGIIFIQVNQFNDKSIYESINLGIYVDRYAKRIDQPSQLTDKVIQLMKSRGH